MMKQFICIILVVFMLAGCTPSASVPGTTAPTTVTTAPQTSVPDTVPATTVPATTTPETTVPEATVPEISLYVPTQPVIDTHETGTPDEILAKRRDIVEAEMRRMMSVYWTPEEDITYSLNSASMGIESDKRLSPKSVVTLKAGRIYRGIPYTHGSGSGYGFMTYAIGQDSDGVYTISGPDDQDLTGSSGNRKHNRARIGNDCADAVFWAWAQVSSTITFPLTQNMTAANGCLKVGDYACDTLIYRSSTKQICKDNGEQRMYRAYAQLQKGDAMVLHTGKEGHAVMVCGVHVEYTGNEIDAEKSHVIILEQISSNLSGEKHFFDEKIGKEVYLACGVDTKWSFDTIFKKGYLPVTCQELIDPAPRPEEKLEDTISEINEKTILRGMVTCNYRISNVTATVTDTDGTIVQRATLFGRENETYSIQLDRFTAATEKPVLNGYIDLNALPVGNYHITLTCRVSTGREIPFRDLDITV